MDRLEDVLRHGESAHDLILLLRGGEDTQTKLLRQAALLEARYTFEGVPARGISLFAARGDLEARTILGTKLRTYPKYRSVSGAALGELAPLLPTFQVPHWTCCSVGRMGAVGPREPCWSNSSIFWDQCWTIRSTSPRDRGGGEQREHTDRRRRP
ncbi:MAG: hypothetical protein M3445_11450 [Actinomycetota bacterium]|nr:hypothetical protein [Actinomycetota bacterium]